MAPPREPLSGSAPSLPGGGRDAFTLRPAGVADTEFCWTVHWEALGGYVTEVFGTDRAGQRAFFDERVDVTDLCIVVVDGRDAGVLGYGRRGDHVYLGTIALLRAYRSRGLGTALVRHVIAWATGRGLPVRLQVLRSNPGARALYARLGFEVDGRTDTHDQMVRGPTTSS